VLVLTPYGLAAVNGVSDGDRRGHHHSARAKRNRRNYFFVALLAVAAFIRAGIPPVAARRRAVDAARACRRVSIVLFVMAVVAGA
jgi:hypothetical protein